MLQFVQDNLIWVALAAVSGGMLLWSLIRGGANGVSPTEATLMINRQDAVVIDVRETSEWNGGHIADSHHIALAQLEKRVTELEKFKSRPIVVYCATGGRAQSAIATLKRAGFDQVFNLAGGLGAWTDANLPTTTK
jgi:rhodanese-related sulfurtransferase